MILTMIMMKVKVICVGLSRTGTSSLKAALSILLPGLTYHGMDFLNEVNSRESHEFWTAMRDGTASKEMIVKYFRYNEILFFIEMIL